MEFVPVTLSLIADTNLSFDLLIVVFNEDESLQSVVGLPDTKNMRIIGGTDKGRTILQPKSAKTRPLSDLAREGLFNILGSVEGYRVLDAFAGSGAVGLEALSRGAASVDAIEIGRAARQAINQNVGSLGYKTRYRLYPITVEKWLAKNPAKAEYDLIFVGAPFGYELTLILELVAKLLKTDGILVVEWFKKIEPHTTIGDLTLQHRRQFGESILAFYNI